MATYKGIKGFTIQTITGDPPAPILGQIWYNTTSNVLKGYVTTTAGWSTATAIPPPARSDWGGAGTISAALAWGGTPFDNVGTSTLEYDGSTWTSGGTMTSSMGGNAGLGTQTAALGVGGHNATGYQSDTAMEYNGTAWTAVTADPANSGAFRGTAGIQTAGMTVGGYSHGGGSSNVTSLWSGSAWTTGGVYPAPRQYMGANGTTAAAFAAGGEPSFVTTANTYDGSTWTATGSLNTGRAYGGTGGSTTAGLYFGGGTPSKVDLTESFDGTSWAVASAMNTARNGIAQGWAPGSSDLGVLAMGGQTPPFSLLVEEWDGGGDSVVTLTSS